MSAYSAGHKFTADETMPASTADMTAMYRAGQRVGFAEVGVGLYTDRQQQFPKPPPW